MNTEDDEFKRIEAESGWRKRQVQAVVEDDDDIQVYKKPWVGLTDEEIRNFRLRYKFSKELLKEVETILRSKNT